MARFYADENFWHNVVAVLRALGHDVLTAQEVGQAQQRIGDPKVLEFAVIRDRIVLTFNRKDFRKLHRATQSHSGIVICKQDKDVSALANRIDAAVKAHESLAGRLIRVNKPG